MVPVTSNLEFSREICGVKGSRNSVEGALKLLANGILNKVLGVYTHMLGDSLNQDLKPSNPVSCQLNTHTHKLAGRGLV